MILELARRNWIQIPKIANMTSVILLVMLAALAYIPRYESAVIRHEVIKRQANPENVPPKEIYKINYEGDNGSFRTEVGKLLNPGTKNQKLLVEGDYGFQVNGISYYMKYTAGDEGYVPKLYRSNYYYPQRFVPLSKT